MPVLTLDYRHCDRKRPKFIKHIEIEAIAAQARQGIVPNCMKIMRALATTGEVALIDEATGYQYHRAPDALQELISKLQQQFAVARTVDSGKPSFTLSLDSE